MFVTMMKSKLNRATVTQADLDYEGSSVIDRGLLEASDIFANEQVDVLNIVTGARFTIYPIEAPRGCSAIGVGYCQLPVKQARSHAANVVLQGEDNQVKTSA